MLRDIKRSLKHKKYFKHQHFQSVQFLAQGFAGETVFSLDNIFLQNKPFSI